MVEAKKKVTKKAAVPTGRQAPPKEKAVPKRRKVKAEEVKPVEIPAVEVKEEVPAPVVAPPVVAKVIVTKPKRILPVGPRYFGTGRRKESIAKVWLMPGSGKVLLNQRVLSDYFCGRKLLEFQVNRPFAVTKTAGSYDVYADVYGGGVPGQAGAVGLGIARALVQLNPEFKVLLKREGLLTRDPRMKERKKYGLKRARRAFQYTKR